MSKYTPEQIMAAVERLADGTGNSHSFGAKPLLAASTTEIAREVRAFAGDNEYRTGSSDVTPLLAELVAAGRLVTYRRKAVWSRRHAESENEAYAHIAPRGDHSQRYYATPENAGLILQRQREQADTKAAAEAARERLMDALISAAPIPLPGGPDDVRVRGDRVHLIMSPELADWLIERIRQGG